MTLRDFALAFRSLRKAPVFTLTAAITIALGIGATTAIFSVARAVLLRPLPYRDPGRLVVLYEDLRARHDMSMPFSNENFTDVRNGTRDSFDDVGGVQTGRVVLPSVDGTPEQVRLAVVTTNFFRVMGAPIQYGRDFTDEDGLPQPQPPPGAAQTGPQPPQLPVMAILSYDYWQRRYGGRTDVLGQGIAFGGPQGLRVVGVLAPGFELLFPSADNMEARPEVWIANRVTYNNANRNGYGIRPVGRLKAGATLAQAQDQAEAVSADIRAHFPVYGGADAHVRLEPMHRSLVAEVRPAILALMGAALFLLLIACANVANLLLVRASMRETELAMRAALGAGWWRIARQMLAEAAVLAGLGTVLGIALAVIGVRALLSIAPPNLPRLDRVTMDPVVIAFGMLMGVIAAALFGMSPAWRAFRMDVMDVLRGGSRTEGLGRGSVLRSAVVVSEVALCFVLLIGSGLMLRTYRELQRVDPGFDPHGTLTFELLFGRPTPPAARVPIVRTVQEKLRGLPGVQSVTAAFPFPLDGNFSTIRWGTEAALGDTSKFQATGWQRVLPGYFETMRMQLVEGRTFTDADNESKRNVVVVDQMLASKAFPNQSAIGKRILIRIRTPEPEWVEIIGVVRHQRMVSLLEPGREEVFFTDGFMGFGGTRNWAIRAAGDPAKLSEAVRDIVRSVDPQLLVTDFQTLDDLVYRAQASTRFSLLLIASLALMAAVLVAVGLYGVLSTMVRQRSAEIGVRMALGSQAAGIVRLVVGQGLRLSAAGIVLGVVAALALTRLIASMLLGVGPSDPLTYAGMALAFLAVATAAAWLPARRAAALDPTLALRGE